MPPDGVQREVILRAFDAPDTAIAASPRRQRRRARDDAAAQARHRCGGERSALQR
jgi:hypothetical protein